MTSPLGHGYAMQAFLALHTSDLADATRLISTASAIGARSGEPPADGAHRADRRHLPDGLAATGQAATRSCRSSRRPTPTFDEIYSSGWSNLTYLEVEQRRLPEAAEMLDVSLPLTIERELPICRVWQLGSRGRLRMLAGDWVQAAADADDVLSGPSAPLALTWPHLVRGLVALRRDRRRASADLDAAWALALRYGEPMRLLPAAAGASSSRRGSPVATTPASTTCRALLADGSAKPGLEWSRGELATWLHRLDPATGPGVRRRLRRRAVPPRAHRSARRRPRRAGPSSASRTSRRWRWSATR